MCHMACPALFHDWDGFDDIQDVICDAGSPSLSGSDVLDDGLCDFSDGGSLGKYRKLKNDGGSLDATKSEAGHVNSKARQSATSCRLVSRSWGVSHATYLEGEMVLIDLDVGAELKVATILKIAGTLQDVLGCRLLRWKGSTLLVAFKDATSYADFARTLTGTHSPSVSLPYSIRCIQRALYADFPPCFLLTQHDATAASVLQSQLDQVFCTFQSQFRFITLADVETTVPSSARQVVSSDGIPSMGVVLLFTGAHQANANTCLRALRSATGVWVSADLPSEVTATLRSETPSTFRHRTESFPFIAVATGQPLDGVRIVVYARDRVSFDAMVKFYRRLLGGAASTCVRLSSCIVYEIFSQTSRHSEFVLAFYDGMSVQHTANVNLCFLLRNNCDELLKDSVELASGYRSLIDPDGNRVLYTSPLE